MTCVVYTKTNRQHFSPLEEVRRHLAAANAVLTSSFGLHKAHEANQRRYVKLVSYTDFLFHNFSCFIILKPSKFVLIQNTHLFSTDVDIKANI